MGSEPIVARRRALEKRQPKIGHAALISDLAGLARISKRTAMAYQAGSALRKLPILIGSQFISRIFTFVLNVLVARSISLAAYGMFSVNFYLLDSIILMIAREGLRRACTRYAPFVTHVSSSTASSTGNDGVAGKHASSSIANELLSHRRQQMLNAVWGCVPLAAVVALIVTPFFLSRSVSEGGVTDELMAGTDISIADQRLALWICALASVVNVLGEPLYVLADCHLMTGLRATVETVAVLARCVLTYIFVVVLRWGILSFALAQLAYAAMFTAGYFVAFMRIAQRNRQRIAAGNKGVDLEATSLNLEAPHIVSITQILPSTRLISLQVLSRTGSSSVAQSSKPGLEDGDVVAAEQAMFPDDASWGNRSLVSLAASFTKQSVWKLLLTEGEKFVLVYPFSYFMR